VIYTIGQAGREERVRLGVPRSRLLPKPYSSAELAGAIVETVGDPT
jgi:hypothetical protein